MASASLQNGSTSRTGERLRAGVFIYVIVLLILATASTARADDGNLTELRMDLQRLLAQTEALRVYMGVPESTSSRLVIHNVSLYDLFFLAQALFGKVNKLSFEIIRLSEQQPKMPQQPVQAGDILAFIRPAKSTVEQILREFNMNIEPPGKLMDFAATPDALFQAMLDLNHQINALLERPYAPADVYGQVTLAVKYAARLLAAYPKARRIPVEPTHESAKQPGDVYLRLIRCLQLITKIYAAADLPAVTLKADNVDKAAIASGDTYDLTCLVLARLDFLHLSIVREPFTREAVFPGRRFPSDVFQRAGLLEKQLQQLEALMTDHGSSPSLRNETPAIRAGHPLK